MASRTNVTTRKTSAPRKRRAPRGKRTLAARIERLAQPLAFHWLSLAAVVVIPSLTIVGLQHLEGYVDQEIPLYAGKLEVKLVDLPGWLANSPWVRGELSEAITADDLAFRDPEVTAKVAARAEASPWVRKVERVSLAPEGRILVKCEYRRPAAFVEYGGEFCLVDDQGVRLPGRWRRESLGTTRFLMIHGVQAVAPEPGHLWAGDDLQAGLELAAFVEDQPFRHQLVGIDVSNHMGRRSPAASHLEIVTESQARICWGRPLRLEVPPEPDAATKLNNLRYIYRKHRQVDMHQAVLDVSKDRYNVYPKPWEPSPSAELAAPTPIPTPDRPDRHVRPRLSRPHRSTPAVALR